MTVSCGGTRRMPRGRTEIEIGQTCRAIIYYNSEDDRRLRVDAERECVSRVSLHCEIRAAIK